MFCLDAGPLDAKPFAFGKGTIWRRHVFALMGQTKEDLRRLKSASEEGERGGVGRE